MVPKSQVNGEEEERKRKATKAWKSFTHKTKGESKLENQNDPSWSIVYK